MKRSLKAKLRIRFVLFSMLCLLIIQSLIVGVSIYQNHQDLVSKSDILISQLHQNPSDSNRYFSVKIPAGKDSVYPDTVHRVSVTPEEATVLTRRVLKKGQESGFIDGYRYHIYRNENGTKIYFLFRESSIEMCKTAAKNMILVSLIGFFAVGIFLIPVSARVVKPLVDNHKKQKQFITAASHELKTPLTVISTNAQLLESEIGENPWINGIQKQIDHLTRMTCDLVTLSKAEEYDNPLQRERFSFSQTLSDILDHYEAIVKQKSLRLERVVSEDAVYFGSREEVEQLIRILLDNAFKYCPEEGFVHVETKKALSGVRLVVTNTTKPLSQENAKNLLRRFYRGQNATDREGFGLGLSIAEAIVARHNGTLTVSTPNHTKFCVTVLMR